ncbi:MAG: hypothetical protein JNL38_02850 [Myxococcales bacterium]|nr:hypothetical protein [Myxococcales bacterium]
MATPRILLLGTALSVCVSYAVLACSRPNPDQLTGGAGTYEPVGNPKQKKKDAGASTSSSSSSSGGARGDAATSDPPPAPSDAGSSKSLCASSATRDACSQCCDAQNPAAVDAWGRLWDACACAPAACGAACGTSYCAPAGGDTPTDECLDCLAAATNTCTAEAYAKCPGDAACAPLTQCESAARCGDKS